MKPEISIIVPIYKVESYLEKCLDSILNQTFTDFELILIDDGSPDRCGEICDEYEKRDMRVRVVHKENGGLSSARNRGIQYAQGNYIGFIDSDDFIHPRMYETLYKALVENKADIAMCNFKKVHENDEIKTLEGEESISFESYSSNEALLKLDKEPLLWNIVVNKLYSKKLFDKERFTQGIIFEDIDIMYRLIYQTKKIVYTSVKLYYYLQRENSILHTKYTIKRLQKLEVLENRMGFARDNKINSFLYNTQKKYIESIFWNYKMINECVLNPQNEVKKLQTRLKKYIGDFILNPKIGLKQKLAILVFIISSKLYEKIT